MAKQKLSQEEREDIGKGKKKTPSYLSARRILPAGEYTTYREQRKMIRKMNLRRKSREMAEEIPYRHEVEDKAAKYRRYKQTRTGRFAGALTRGIRTLQTKHGIARATYRQQPFSVPVPTGMESRYKTVMRTKSGMRGRPKGTYDKRYARFGGVYSFRKLQAQQRWKERNQLMSESAANPQQQQILRQIRAREAYARMSPESHIVPDTYGQVPLSNIFSDIDKSVNLVP